MAWTSILGIALLLWVAWDLYAGSVWLHREYFRNQDPWSYWILILVWILVAVSCFYW
ncbi:hypothetical protein [Neptunomonas japonica]|uniref:hypothetical protein n=1 Tax=Neptunomonas japonica TaxID=417574 RepID=UPI00146D934E|nr:hypothetical protein [Neptunomonas japonica]